LVLLVLPVVGLALVAALALGAAPLAAGAHGAEARAARLADAAAGLAELDRLADARALVGLLVGNRQLPLSGREVHLADAHLHLVAQPVRAPRARLDQRARAVVHLPAARARARLARRQVARLHQPLDEVLVDA